MSAEPRATRARGVPACASVRDVRTDRGRRAPGVRAAGAARAQARLGRQGDPRRRSAHRRQRGPSCRAVRSARSWRAATTSCSATGRTASTARACCATDGLHTGDLARMDDEGYLFIVGRESEMIKSGAHRIAPREIEEVIERVPGVRECARSRCARRAAWVRRSPRSSCPSPACAWIGRSVLRACLTALPRFKLPEHVFELTAICRAPRAASYAGTSWSTAMSASRAHVEPPCSRKPVPRAEQRVSASSRFVTRVRDHRVGQPPAPLLRECERQPRDRRRQPSPMQQPECQRRHQPRDHRGLPRVHRVEIRGRPFAATGNRGTPAPPRTAPRRRADRARSEPRRCPQPARCAERVLERLRVLRVAAARQHEPHPEHRATDRDAVPVQRPRQSAIVRR